LETTKSLGVVSSFADPSSIPCSWLYAIADPLLTPTGVDQAKAVRKMWEQEMSAGLGIPSKIYSSPFSRALRTCYISFDMLLDDDSKVLIVEVSNDAE
jgi:broad specificity phosphatase PhoE